MKKSNKRLIKEIREGVRLNTPSPKVIVPKKVYKRKPKHKDRLEDQ